MTTSIQTADSSNGKKEVSGRLQATMRERVGSQQTYAADPKFKKYTTQVEKCLNTFDSVHEWADFIAFLKQLLKTLQSYQQFKEIPRKLLVSKRLAQCLNPALPAGVHQRALDVYAHLLAVIGSDGLKRDLPLWSSGLFPFFEYASTSVKPILLNIYDTHYLPLQAGLRPVMKSFVLALLPGLEEETGEFFEKADQVLSLLDRLSGTVSPAFFFQNIWLVMLTTPSARGTSLNFVSRRLPKPHADEDMTIIVGRDIGLMIRAFSAALEDENLLVRRGALDLLVQSLRIDSSVVKMAQADDRVILMRAAAGVVLRRDLSLNRRFYTWVLGPDENSQHQIDYFKTHSLGLLKSTLRDEMFSPSSDYSNSRPFKIFLSLLDKWEIGTPLTESLVYDAFKALKRILESQKDDTDDILMTASTLYEAIEPHALWKELLSRIFSELKGDGNACEAIHMAKFILTTFRHDDEVLALHLPIVFCAVVDLVKDITQRDALKILSRSVQEAILLQEGLSQLIPPSALKQWPALLGEAEGAPVLQGPRTFACIFYGIDMQGDEKCGRVPSNVPLSMVLEDLIQLSVTSARSLTQTASNTVPIRGVLNGSLQVLTRLVEGSYDGDGPLSITWSAQDWLTVVLEALEHETASFIVVDCIVTAIIQLYQARNLEPSLSIDARPIMFKMINTLLKYLRSDKAVYHVRAVNLIWSLENAVERPHVESIVAQSLMSPEPRNVQDSYEAFGVLWRLSDDHFLPGSRLKVPMMIVLDTLKSDDPQLRRIGETWMRCSLKSYLRVLDPILHDLLDPSIHRTLSSTELNGKELQSFTYERPFDQRYVIHVLDILLSIVRFGGQGFAKTARISAIRHSQNAQLLQRLDTVFVTHGDATYMDVVLELLIRYLQSEPAVRWVAVMRPFNNMIQAISVDLLQAIVSRGEIDSPAIQTIEAAVVGKLYFTVHTGRLDLQNKLLHLLHSVISASSVALDHGTLRERSTETHGPKDVLMETNTQISVVNPLLIQTLLDGISTATNRPVLQHWLDFILTTVPQFRRHFEHAVSPLNDCLCRQLEAALMDVSRASRSDQGDSEDVCSSTSDSEFIMFLNVLERLVLLSLDSSLGTSHVDDESASMDKTGQESSGLLGYMSNVFSSENVPNSADGQLTARSRGYHSLDEGVRVLYSIWVTMVWSDPQQWSSKDHSLSLIYSRTRARCRRVLEHLFRAHSAEVLESIVDCWSHEVITEHVQGAFELVDVLSASAQTVVHMICESISCRISGISEKTRKQAINPNLSDITLFQFLENYLQQLEGPLALQVSARFLQLAKDVIGNVRDMKVQVFPVLKCVAVIGEKITQTTATEDRRIRKDIQDSFSKLLEASVTIAGRSFDQGTWMRRGRESLITNGRDSPIPRAVSETRLDEKFAASSSSLQDVTKPTGGTDLVDQINQFLVTTALPNMRKFFIENDKVLVACSNIIYYIVNPAMKGKQRALDIDDVVLDIIREMTRIPAALKAWRGPVVDALNDNRFFNSTAEAGLKWKPVVKAFFDTDRTAMGELLSKIATAPSTAIFTNREYENLLRSLNLRRLSYVLFTSEKNHFLTQLPTIQEKLVDILRNSPAPIIQSEVYLCTRILLCRLSPHNLTSFWPVILTELYRLFDQAIISLPSDGSDDLPLILSVSKFMDLLLVLQTEEFQIHQWMFITDTVDAVYRPDDWSPEALLDILAEVAGDLPVPENTSTLSMITHPMATPLSEPRPLRRPMLNSIRQIDSIRDLVPFFSHVSIASYESVYASGGNIDWDAVERGLMEDMFDGR